MLRILARSPEEGFAHHYKNPVRVYEDDSVQRERIMRARGIVQTALVREEGNGISRIVELGCGTADISGPFSDQHMVVGIDCALPQLEEARRRFLNGKFLLGPAEYFVVDDCSVIVLCEFLEHVENPSKIVERWLPRAKWSVISHPIDEPMGSGLSGGDHCWSFGMEDFQNWFKLGGHMLEQFQDFQMGQYKIALGLGRRIEKSNEGEKA